MLTLTGISRIPKSTLTQAPRGRKGLGLPPMVEPRNIRRVWASQFTTGTLVISRPRRSLPVLRLRLVAPPSTLLSSGGAGGGSSFHSHASYEKDLRQIEYGTLGLATHGYSSAHASLLTELRTPVKISLPNIAVEALESPRGWRKIRAKKKPSRQRQKHRDWLNPYRTSWGEHRSWPSRNPMARAPI